MSGSTPAWDDDRLLDWIWDHADDFDFDSPELDDRPALRAAEQKALLAPLHGKPDGRRTLAKFLRNGTPTAGFLTCLAELIEAGGLGGAAGIKNVELDYDQLFWDLRLYTAALQKLFPEKRDDRTDTARRRAAQLLSVKYGEKPETLLRRIDYSGEPESRRLRLEARVRGARIIP